MLMGDKLQYQNDITLVSSESTLCFKVNYFYKTRIYISISKYFVFQSVFLTYIQVFFD
jgi:hypothetical protein